MQKPTSHLKASSDKAIELYVEQCMLALKKSGNRVTETRRAVMRCLAGSKQSMSPKAILESVQADRSSPKIDQVTVYRILEAFTRLGLVHQVSPSGEYMACTHVDCCEELHALTRCKSCGSTTELDIPSEMISPLLWYLEQQVMFQHTSHFFQIDGICRTCLGKK